ncbi:MAG: hypothetical protein ABW092_14495 [Candidatus Thiodiazotropha sp.]
MPLGLGKGLATTSRMRIVKSLENKNNYVSTEQVMAIYLTLNECRPWIANLDDRAAIISGNCLDAVKGLDN